MLHPKKYEGRAHPGVDAPIRRRAFFLHEKIAESVQGKKAAHPEELFVQ
jgi:hypothetical protein